MKRFALILIVLGFIFSYSYGESNKVIVIAKFKNASFNRGLDFLSTSIPEILTTSLSGIKGLAIVERDQTEKIFEEKKLALSGFGDAQDYTVVGEELSANSVIVGSFTVVGKYVRIDARLIDIGAVKVLATYQVSAEIGRDLENKIAALSQKIRFSITGEAYGQLSVLSTVESEIIFDGQLIGSTPLEERFVSIGEHTVLVGKRGYEDSRSTFEIKPLEKKILRIDMRPLPRFFQIDFGIGAGVAHLGYENGLYQSAPLGFDAFIEPHLYTFSLAASYHYESILFRQPVFAPLDKVDTNSIYFDNHQVQLSLRYYPFTGTYTAFAGLGISVDTLANPKSALSSVSNQTTLTPFVDIGGKINFFNENISIVFTTQLRLPASYSLTTKSFSIFGEESFNSVTKKTEWVQMKLGVSFNVF